MDNDAQPAETVEAVERAVGVLNALKNLDGAGVTELSEYLGMSKSGVYKQLSTLVKTGMVTKQQTEYRLSFRFLLMGEYVKTNSQLYAIGADEVDKLAEKSSYFAYLTAMGREYAYCIHTADGEGSVVPNLSVGKQITLHSSAAGKAILSRLPDPKRDRLLDGTLTGKTENTITDRTTLEDELQTIRQEGIAFEDEENVPGMRGVGAPILSEDGGVVGAVAISGPLSLLTENHLTEEVPALVKQTKNFIEVKFSLESRDPLEEGSHIPEDLY
jgi:DNA-binding IclR family transcriptional regulator